MNFFTKIKTIFLFFIILLFTILSNCKTEILPNRTNTTPKAFTSNELSDVHKALQEIAYAYYMKGENLQYNSMKGNPSFYSPEETTSQNTNYFVCSAFVKNVYYQLLGIKTPEYTSDLLSYGSEFAGVRPEVFLYVDVDGKKFYNGTEQTVNPDLTDIIPNLQIGDIMTYTGHTMLVYDLVYTNGNVTDALLMHSTHGTDGLYVKTKISPQTAIQGLETFGSANHLLYHNEGSLKLELLTDHMNGKDITTYSEYSILRFIQEDEYGNYTINYNDTENNKCYDNTAISLSDKNKDRLKFKHLYIEKTVDVHAGSVVEANQELTYSIIVKNNSDAPYSDTIKISESISDYVVLTSYSSNKEPINLDEQKVEWEFEELSAGEQIEIEYTVVVKEHCYGETIESKGKVGNIASATIKNKIANNLTDEQTENIIANYYNLKDSSNGKELIDLIYFYSFGINLNSYNLFMDNLISNTNTSSTSSTTISLNPDNAFSDLVLNNYWSTLCKNSYTFKESTDVKYYDLKLWKNYTNIARRADTIYPETFKTGDILIYTNSNDATYSYNKTTDTISTTPITYESGEYAYIYIEGEGFVGVNLGNDGLAGTQDDRNKFSAKYYKDNNLTLYGNKKNSQSIDQLDSDYADFLNYQTLFGKDSYVILRPSIARDIVNMELTIFYNTTSLTNQNVTATITSNEEMWNVEGWILSEDKKTLTKEFSQNAEEDLTIYDHGGNPKTITAKINNIDKTVPEYTVNYSTTSPTNQNVTVTISATEEIQSIDGWTLLDKTLTKTFSSNTYETITISDLAGNTTNITITINNIDTTAPQIDVQYEIDSDNNVTVSIISNEALEGLEGWTLSDNSTVLTKTFTSNQDIDITISDLAGNTITQTISIKDIDETIPAYTINYSETLPTNQNVRVTISATEEIQEITDWTLSEDKKTLTKEFSQNTEETIEIKDIAGNTITETISIKNIDKMNPEYAVDYSETSLTNQNVRVTVSANEEIQAIADWILSEDKKTLTKEFPQNAEETIEIKDIAGNTITETISIKNIDKTNPEYTVKFSTFLLTNQNVTVTISTDEEIQEIDGWNLSEDKKTLTKEFSQNTEETIEIKDIAGNSITAKINITNIIKVEATIKDQQNPTEDKADDKTNEKTDDKTIAKVELPNTGKNILIISGILILISSIAIYAKLKKYKDIK